MLFVPMTRRYCYTFILHHFALQNEQQVSLKSRNALQIELSTHNAF